MQPGDIAVHIGGGVSATGHCWILLKKEREEDGTALWSVAESSTGGVQQSLYAFTDFNKLKVSSARSTCWHQPVSTPPLECAGEREDTGPVGNGALTLFGRYFRNSDADVCSPMMMSLRWTQRLRDRSGPQDSRLPKWKGKKPVTLFGRSETRTTSGFCNSHSYTHIQAPENLVELNIIGLIIIIA